VYLFLPLASSILYVIAALFLKQASVRGIDLWRTAFVCNTTTAILFLCLWPFGGEPIRPSFLWQPLVVAVLFVLAQVLNLLALKIGDVSVATPVMGSKVVLVALFTTLLGAGSVPPPLWVAAVLSGVGLGFLNRKGESHHEHILRTVLLALSAAASYAIFDVLVMTWSPAWGVGRFLPLVMIMSALLSLGFVPLFRKRALPEATGAQRPLYLGAFFIALQALILVSTLGLFGNATAVNVIYSTRGLWSVLAVWWLGHLFANNERAQGNSVFRARLIGAVCLCAAVVLVFL
jgi:drug/metabolite transporter (DMT)-like permease